MISVESLRIRVGSINRKFPHDRPQNLHSPLTGFEQTLSRPRRISLRRLCGPTPLTLPECFHASPVVRGFIP